jgi:hypothetical protein
MVEVKLAFIDLICRPLPNRRHAHIQSHILQGPPGGPDRDLKILQMDSQSGSRPGPPVQTVKAPKYVMVAATVEMSQYEEV